MNAPTASPPRIPRTRHARILSLLVITLLIAASGWLAAVSIQSSYLEVGEEYLKVAVEDRHVVIEQFLDERLNLLKLITRTAPDTNHFSQRMIEETLTEMVRIYSDYQALSAYRADGTLLARSGLDPEGELLPMQQEWFDVALRGGHYVSPLYLGPNDVPTLAMAVYARPANEPIVVRATLRLDSLSATLGEMVAGETGGTYLVDPIAGTYLSRPYFGGHPLRDISERFNWGRKHYHVDYEEHGIEEVDAGSYVREDGTRVVEAHCCTRQGAWLVVVEREVGEVNKISSGLIVKLVSLFTGTLLVVLAVAWAGYRYPRT